MRRNTTHGMEADRTADHPVVLAAAPVRPWPLQDNLFLEGRMRHLGGEPRDRPGLDAAAFGDCRRRIVIAEIGFGHDLEDRPRLAPVGERHLSLEIRPGLIVLRRRRFAATPVEDKRMTILVAREKTVIRCAGSSITSQGALV
jgi:hypothetical protein